MRCQCSICQELFENGDENVISALDCGHTFHNVCLNQWLENGRTCPSCRNQINRKRIIQRLYFDQPEDVDETIDSGQLQNEIDRLKLEVRKKEKAKNDAASEKAELETKVAALEKAKTKLEGKLKEEQNQNSGHLRTLKYYESQQANVENDKGECRRIKQKLVALQGLETLMNGCESEASQIIASTGEGSGAVQNLSRQVAFLKREYEKQKLERRQMKEQFDRCKLQLEKLQLGESQKSKKVTELTEKCKTLEDLLERSEGDLKLAEKEISILRKKNTKLKQVLHSPSAGAGSSSFSQIMNESTEMMKFNANMASTPKLSKGVSREETVDLDVTPDLFASPPPPVSHTQSASQCEETSDEPVRKSVKRSFENDDPNASQSNSTKFLKITTASEKSQTLKRFKSDSSIGGTNSLTTLASMNIFGKRKPGERNDGHSILRKGYDGLGGHTTHVNGLGNPFKKPATKKVIAGSKKLTHKPTKTPPLPKLDGFLRIDKPTNAPKLSRSPFITID